MVPTTFDFDMFCFEILKTMKSALLSFTLEAALDRQLNKKE